ncbi:hypothetical protein EYF80_025661 [Liparis tanakae]|uniref:Uncharacterized protein n=1 Tax=Liparis tanakae TaxID=230148 RepID=A0A4Z2HGR9_9TELE|nr:hypothetical protein EYF80_025661 [Liparis tanakae]
MEEVLLRMLGRSGGDGLGQRAPMEARLGAVGGLSGAQQLCFPLCVGVAGASGLDVRGLEGRQDEGHVPAVRGQLGEEYDNHNRLVSPMQEVPSDANSNPSSQLHMKEP